MATDTHRVMKHEDGWQITRDGGRRPSRVVSTKEEATKVGRKISRRQGTEFVVHGEDGSIQQRYSHGNDPNPLKG